MNTERQTKLDEMEAFSAYQKWAKPIAKNMSKRFKTEREVAIDDIMQEGLLGIYAAGFKLDISVEEQRIAAKKAMNTMSIKEYRYMLDKVQLTWNVDDNPDDPFTIELGVDDDFIAYFENIEFWNYCVRLMGVQTRKVMLLYYRNNLEVNDIAAYTKTSRATVYRRLHDGHVILEAALELANSGKKE